MLVEMRSRHCDDSAWGTSWVQQPESDKVSGPNAHKTAGRIGAWKPSYLQAQPGSTCRREEHVENGSATFELLSSGNAIIYLQIISKDEQLRLMRQQCS